MALNLSHQEFVKIVNVQSLAVALLDGIDQGRNDASRTFDHVIKIPDADVVKLCPRRWRRDKIS